MPSEQRAEYQKQYRKAYTKKRIGITVSEKEYTELKNATLKGQSISGTVKRLAQAHLRSAPNVPPLNENTAKELQRLIRTMANNLNQVAHHVNASRLEEGSGYQPSEQMLIQMRNSLTTLQEHVSSLLLPSQDNR